ncbi:MAG: biotin synthase BioB [Deltaproteobacteria bacterium]|nr:biotin synthase BioB [Deltaproteobacteria bacterium]
MPVPIPLESVRRLFERPLLELVYEAATVHREHHDPRKIQRCTLLSIKTGVCSEDCAYCPQSARYDTHVEPERLLSPAEVVEEAQAAAAAGASRFCMGAAWREVKEGDSFETVLEMVRGVAATGMEACVTLGMLTAEQARRLKAAGLTSYNHNLDTSERFYPEIITTRTYEERLTTLRHVQEAGLSVCCGGILGMGETVDDRIDLLCTLANFDPQPESVPINVLVRIEGTPLVDQPPVDPFDVVRAIAAARILMPQSRVRLAAGRLTLSDEAQALCFLAGANSIFFGERLLTTPNPQIDRDLGLLSRLDLDLQEDREPA